MLTLSATFLPLFSAIALLLVEVVMLTAGFRLVCLYIVRFALQTLLLPSCINQPYLWLLGWPFHILDVLLPAPHVMVASGWPRPCSSHSVVGRSDLTLAACAARQLKLMSFGSLSGPGALVPFFSTPLVTFVLTILLTHNMF